MRFGVISDLHIDLYKGDRADFNNALYDAVHAYGVEVLLIPGDISEDCRVSTGFMRELNREIGVPAFYVPGNHDLWNKKNDLETQDIMKAFREDEHCLLGKEKAFGDVAVVGHVGWYDYRYACSELYSPEDLAGKTLHGVAWQDSLYVDFRKPDPEVCDDFCKELSESLTASSSKKIILMTHMLNHPFFLVPSFQGSRWTFFNGFLGSPKLYELTKHPGVYAAVSGHVHYRRRFSENNVLYINACLGYESEWQLFGNTNLTVNQQIRETMVTFEL